MSGEGEEEGVYDDMMSMMHVCVALHRERVHI